MSMQKQADQVWWSWTSALLTAGLSTSFIVSLQFYGQTRLFSLFLTFLSRKRCLKRGWRALLKLSSQLYLLCFSFCRYSSSSFTRPVSPSLGRDVLLYEFPACHRLWVSLQFQLGCFNWMNCVVFNSAVCVWGCSAAAGRRIWNNTFTV